MFDELKTHLRQRRRVLRSKTQGLSYAVRWLRQDDKCIFYGHGAVSASNPAPIWGPSPLSAKKHVALFEATAKLLCESSRGKIKPRMVKRRNSPYAPYKRPRPPVAQIDWTPSRAPRRYVCSLQDLTPNMWHCDPQHLTPNTASSPINQRIVSRRIVCSGWSFVKLTIPTMLFGCRPRTVATEAIDDTVVE